MTIFSKKKLTFKVGFIICGTQKGGTTALDYYLRLHNQICMAKKKEVHFFDEDNGQLIDCDENDIEKINIKKNVTGKKIKSVEVLIKVASDNQNQN